MPQQLREDSQAASNYNTFTAEAPPALGGSSSTEETGDALPVGGGGGATGLVTMFKGFLPRILEGAIRILSNQSYLSTERTYRPSLHLRSILLRPVLLSYRDPETNLYFQGRDDWMVVVLWFIILFWGRGAAVCWVWVPLAKRLNVSPTSESETIEWARAAHSLLCAFVSFNVSIYLLQTSSCRNFRTKSFWTGYPHTPIKGIEKLFYLMQIAFWIQRTSSFLTEEGIRNLQFVRVQQITYLIAVFLLVSSYATNWTQPGISLLCSMGVVDIFLPLLEVIGWSGLVRSTPAAYVSVILSAPLWLTTRVFISGKIAWSVIFESKRNIEYGWRPEEGFFFSVKTHIWFATLILALQLIWTLELLLAICRSSVCQKDAFTRTE
ncbi:hypothetical protein T439DRAFT_369078 [Meredithblackwellia eburnea MCA 4105]